WHDSTRSRAQLNCQSPVDSCIFQKSLHQWIPTAVSEVGLCKLPPDEQEPSSTSVFQRDYSLLHRVRQYHRANLWTIFLHSLSFERSAYQPCLYSHEKLKASVLFQHSSACLSLQAFLAQRGQFYLHSQLILY